MNFSCVLENSSVLLRPLSLEDKEQLQPLCIGQPELYRFMSAYIHTPDYLEQFIHHGLKEQELGKAIPFLVIDKRQNLVAGCTRFGNIEWDHKRLEIGWTWIGASFRATGLNKAMKYLMLQYAFDTLGVNRVEIKTNERNFRSRRAIEGIGGQYEGTLKHHMVNPDGTLRNTVYYSILKEDWPNVKRQYFSKFLKDSMHMIACS